MVVSGLFILDNKGKVLIYRNYRGDVENSAIEKFLPVAMEREDEGSLIPVLQIGEITYTYVKYNYLYLRRICITYCLMLQIFLEYFGEFEEESIRDNFVITYELLDELMDFGYPQTTDTKILQEYITQQSHKLEIAPRPPMAVTNAVSWRSENLKYRKNEVFLDVVESVNLLVSSTGNVLRSEIVGSIKLRVYLSGMPELRLGVNDKLRFENIGRKLVNLIYLTTSFPYLGGKGKSVELEDVKFHQCVKPLIWVEAIIEKHAHSRMEYMVKAKAQFKRRSTANQVEIHIPVPSDVDSPRFKTTMGSAKYMPETNMVVWTIRSFPGGKEYILRASFGLPSVEREQEVESRPPVSVKFEIPYFTVSGLQVHHLKIIEKTGYHALPWVRYITQNGDYQLRTM
ncbi:hypothetical protein P879_01198 [Paragonimus westermani]|uniref:MHD domain-containing protein n=1 Tax=Paragonimus westermani TaxID=34504 RepID=A0A8T0DVS6_9TREM|nr:hypothetical protein P879_01198 [Paragonimus westermani]